MESQETPALGGVPSRFAKERGRLVKPLAALVLVAALAAGGWLWWGGRTYHLATVQEGVLYRDGMKSLRQFDAAIQSVHPKTVVSLVDSREIGDPRKPQFGQEPQYLASHGIALQRIEVTLGGWPTSEDIRKFLGVVSQKQNQPVLVHCAQGVRRTAFFVAAYQESVLGYDRQKARGAILTFGHSDNTVNDINRFIDAYDPVTQSVSQELAHTKPSAE